MIYYTHIERLGEDGEWDEVVTYRTPEPHSVEYWKRVLETIGGGASLRARRNRDILAQYPQPA